MVALNLRLRPARRVRAPAMGRQRGDIMLITLVFLLVCLLALVVSMREGIVSTQMTGNNLLRQKDVQVADLALSTLENNILTTYAGQPLELTALTKPWFRNVPGGTAAPSATPGYWDTCATATSSTTTSCASFAVQNPGGALPYTAYGVVQPTGRIDSTTCQVAQYTAVYYDLFVHVKESNGATSVNTETIYRICTLT